MSLSDHAHTIFTSIVSRDSFKDSYQSAIEKSSFDGQYTAASVIVTISIALAFYNSLEMALLISMTFKRWRGLYFWSLVLSNAGVVGYTLGMMLTYYQLGALLGAKIVLDIGWVSMILCQSLVLYSRLGLIVENTNILNAVKWMIIVDSLLLFPIVIVFDFGSTYSLSPRFAAGYFYIEHIQITGFTVQELSISALYLWKTISLLKVLSKANTRALIWQLFIMNVIIVSMDIVLIVLQYKHLQLYQESVKAIVYSVKLKLELNVLSKLVDLVHGGARDRSMTLDMIDSDTIQGRALSDTTQRKLSVPNTLNAWLTNDAKTTSDMTKQEIHTTMPHLESGPSSSGSRRSNEDGNAKVEEEKIDEDDIDKITRTFSQQSSARTKGRESDALYADFLRSMG